MRKIFLNKIKKMLEDEREFILSRTKQNALIDIDIDGDETDEIQGKILALTTNQLVARDKEKLSQIDAALKKMADNNFGMCEECGEEIVEKRLLVNPGFTTCIGCAEQLEILNKKNRR